MNGTILFSSISPDYERNLKEELFGCFEHMGIPFNVLNEMPVRDRKFYIMRHNMKVEEENAMRNGNNSTNMGDALNSFASLEQQNILNAKKRG